MAEHPENDTFELHPNFFERFEQDRKLEKQKKKDEFKKLENTVTTFQTQVNIMGLTDPDVLVEYMEEIVSLGAIKVKKIEDLLEARKILRKAAKIQAFKNKEDEEKRLREEFIRDHPKEEERVAYITNHSSSCNCMLCEK